MAGGQLGSLMSYLRRLVRAPAAGGCTDRELLARFAAERDEAAFHELVRRHGVMVFNVCRRVLNDPHRAEDAFQATFLVLARKAGAVGWQDSVGSWLYQVAWRVARRALAEAAREQAHERQAPDMPLQDPAAELQWRELRPVLDEELARLPEKYRAPLVLCYLEGKTNEEAARLLGWTKGTVSGRLARARDLMRGRLARRGVTAPATAVAALLAGHAAEASVPAALEEATSKAAVLFAAGETGGVVSLASAALAEGVLKAMWMTKVQIATLILLAVVLLGTGLGLLVHGQSQGPGNELVAAGVPAPERKPEASVPELFQVSEPVKVNDLEFQVLASPLWPAPGPGGQSPLSLQLRVVNRGKDNVRFVPVLGQPVLRTADGKPLRPQEHGRDGLRRLPEPVTLEAGKATTVREPARLFAGAKGMGLFWMDQTGSVWSYDNLTPGKYLLGVQYTAPARAGEWTGQVRTADVLVEIRELKASQPVVSNQLEVCALADGTWSAPAPGKQSRVHLGYRVTNLQKPNWARIIPAIAAVLVQAADGTELPVKKSAVVIPEQTALALHMEPGISRTLAVPALLSHAGQAMALTWVDGAGNVWQIDGLRPGKYTVRLVIQAQKGKTPAEWTTWTGKIQMAAVEVDIAAAATTRD